MRISSGNLLVERLPFALTSLRDRYSAAADSSRERCDHTLPNTFWIDLYSSFLSMR